MAGSKLTPELADKLLDKLGSDDAFRAQFQKDPEAAMKQLGAPADFKCGACMRPQKLASKEDVRKSRATFRSTLLGAGDHNVFSLEVK